MNIDWVRATTYTAILAGTLAFWVWCWMWVQG